MNELISNMGFSTSQRLVSLSMPRGRQLKGAVIGFVGLFAFVVIVSNLHSTQESMTYNAEIDDKQPAWTNNMDIDSKIERNFEKILRNFKTEKIKKSSRPLRKLNKRMNTKLRLSGSHPQYQNSEGCMFYEDSVENCFKTPLNVTLLRFLSPQLENLAIRHFLGVPGDNLMYANSPAFYQERDGNYTIVARMWQEAEAYASLNQRQAPLNVYQDNLFFTVRANDKLEPIDKGHFIGIPSPSSGQIGAGPIEPRLFQFKNRLLVSYNMAYRPGKQSFLDYTFIWDYHRQYVMTPQIKEGGSVVLNMSTASGYQRRDKHWMALIDRNQLFMVQTLEPLRVLQCNVTDEFHCSYVGGARIPLAGVGSVRGGTPFILYKWPFYISAVHSTITRKIDTKYKRYYIFHLLVMSVDPVFKIEYMTEAINIHPLVLKSCPIVRHLYIADEFFFPVSIHLETDDSIVVGGHINDHSAAVFRVTGIREMMAQVMKLAKDAASSGTKASSPRRVVQHAAESLNDFAVRTSSRATGYTLFKSKY
ncbi:uncharacterized protein LOC141911634 [Tubulanus polymorphus]|uniref:uncharacterized protein LOC141911634 n=1 Tax=Tubulanus polymorphus TaxID=672921 RepID=UPI003DA34450